MLDSAGATSVLADDVGAQPGTKTARINKIVQ